MWTAVIRLQLINVRKTNRKRFSCYRVVLTGKKVFLKIFIEMTKCDAEIFISMRGSVFHQHIAVSSDRGGLMSVEAADLK